MKKRRIYSIGLSILLCASAILTTAPAHADERPVPKNKLPQQARNFLTKHYSGEQITSATMDKDLFDATYDVSLNDGTKVEFTNKGEWTEICSPRNGFVPVSAVPDRIAAYVRQHYPTAKIRKIEREYRNYEVELNNGVEMIFNKNFDLIRTNDYYQHKPNTRFEWQ